MESSLLFIFGSVKNVITGSILTIDGNLAEGTQKDEGSIGDTDERFNQGVEKTIKIAIRAFEKF